MDNSQLQIEFYSEIPSVTEDIRREVRDRLEALTEGHKDIIESSIAIEDIAGEETPYLYEVRIVVYMRPENIAVVEKGEAIRKTVKDALTTVERQVRKERARRKEKSQKAKKMEAHKLYELSPQEIYETFTPSQEPQAILEQGRSQLAASLMMEEEMEQKAAYYIADRILEFVEETMTAS